MNNITIPKKAMDIAMTRGLNSTQIENRIEKFANVMQEYYPHLSRNECYKILNKLEFRQIDVNVQKQYLQNLKKEMHERYQRYQGYIKTNDFKEKAICEEYYVNLDKKSYDRVVDELREVGINKQYAPSHISDVARFSKPFANSTDVQVIIMGLVFTTLLLGSIFWEYIF